MEPNNEEQEALIASAQEARDKFRETLASIKTEFQATEAKESTDEEVL
jgi:hypothetical protein